MTPKEWARRELRRGDLSVLASIARGNAAHSEDDRVERLAQRGFLVKRDDDRLSVTLAGHAALGAAAAPSLTVAGR